MASPMMATRPAKWGQVARKSAWARLSCAASWRMVARYLGWSAERRRGMVAKGRFSGSANVSAEVSVSWCSSRARLEALLGES